MANAQSVRLGKPKGFKAFINNNNTVGILFALPFIIGFLGFTIIPMCASLYISFTSYKMVTSPVWIGLDNFKRLFTQDPRFYRSLLVTIRYVIFSVPLKLISALLVALLLVRKHRGVSLYRSIYYFPALVGGSVAVTLVWKELFSHKGLINTLIVNAGLVEEPLSWFGSSQLAIWPLILLTVWQFGASMIIFAAGLKQIPEIYYEAATIDGAGPIRRFFTITLPMITPIIFFNLIMQLIGGFMSFNSAYIISNGTGGPNDMTNFIALYIYNQTFSVMNMGYSSAMSWILLVVIAGITFAVFKSSSAWVFYESSEY
jgi:multiple sugar transport system permease protein